MAALSEEGGASSLRRLISSSSKQASQKVFICPHAVAFHNVVYGTSTCTINKTTKGDVEAESSMNIKQGEIADTSGSPSCNDSNHDQENNFVRGTSNKRRAHSDAAWWSWKNEEFTAKYPISRLVSNASGSILAIASEEMGTVSLLRGSDGKTLATRQVSGPDQSISLQFLSSSSSAGGPVESADHTKEETQDTLWIETRVPDEAPTLIIVANIMGEILNGNDPRQLAQAAARFKIVQVPFKEMLMEEDRILAFHEDAQTIRLLVCRDQEAKSEANLPVESTNQNENDPSTALVYNWTVLDFDLAKEQMMPVSEHSSQLPEPFDSWEIDSSRGFCLGNSRLVICSASCPLHTALLWWNPSERSKPILHSLIVDHNVLPFDLRSAYKSKRFRILSFTPLKEDSNDIQDSSVVACAIQAADECWTIVVRAICNSQAPIEPHVLFCVPMEQGQVMSLSSLNTAMGFRAWLSPRREKRATVGHVTVDFVPQSDMVPILSQVRQLVKQGDFDQAEHIAGTHQSLSSLDFCDYHDSEISFARLSQLVAAKGNHGEPPQSWLSQVKQSLSSLDVHHLLVASDSLWNTSLKNKDLVRLWTSMDMNLKRAMQQDRTRTTKHVEALQERIESRLEILKLVDRFCLDALESEIESICSARDLWLSLFRLEAFDSVSNIYSTLGEHDHQSILSIDSLVSAFCETVTKTTDPQNYIGLLEKVIIPRLNSVNHPLLVVLRAWCCQTANGLDDIDMLDDAIKVLTVCQF